MTLIAVGQSRLARPALVVGALAAGLAAGWAAGGRVVLIGGLAVVVAAINGYSKAYSP